MGLVGGGPGAFIGGVHRKASHLDGEIELVAGAFDIDPKKSKDMGRHLALDPNRVYNDYTEIIKAESALPPEQRIDFAAVTTPNNWHFPIARDFLKAGFHVMCEKPMTLNSKEAKDLQKLVEKTGLVFGLMHNYTGYPVAKLAKNMAKKGDLGKIRKVVVQCPAWAEGNKGVFGKGTVCEPYMPFCCTDMQIVARGDIATPAGLGTVDSSARQRPPTKEIEQCEIEKFQFNAVRFPAIADMTRVSEAFANAETSRIEPLRHRVPLWYPIQYIGDTYDSLPPCAFGGLLGKTGFSCGPFVARNIVRSATGYDPQAAISHQHRPYLIDDFWLLLS